MIFNFQTDNDYGVHEKAFKELYGEHSDKLYNFILWMTHSKPASDDILQTVFIRVWKQPAAPATISEQEAWLFTIARNCCMDFFRSCQRSTRFRLKYSRERQSTSYNEADRTFTWEILSELSDIEKSIIYLHIKMGYNYKEIAQSLDLKENAVRVKAFRAFRRLRKKLSKEGQ
ncbi:MAG: sigma-70 family RNA polymerase sigma factor [Chitinivibrionales bacterium]|nr:sigma-70 family RNA polymerase sigma factor [Chitinivibrionales bacterium]